MLNSRDITLPTKLCLAKAMIFPVVMYWCESLTIKKAELRRTDASKLWLEKSLEIPLDCKEIQPVNPKGNQSRILIGRTDAEASILWPPDVKNWLTGKDTDAGKDWRQEEKGMIEDEMVGWHHWLNGHVFEQAPGVMMDREAWRATVHGVAKSRTRLSWTTLIGNIFCGAQRGHLSPSKKRIWAPPGPPKAASLWISSGCLNLLFHCLLSHPLGPQDSHSRNTSPSPLSLSLSKSFPCGSAGEESTFNAGDLGSILGLGRSPGEGKGYTLQNSDLGSQSQTWHSNFHFTPLKSLYFSALSSLSSYFRPLLLRLDMVQPQHHSS